MGEVRRVGHLATSMGLALLVACAGKSTPTPTQTTEGGSGGVAAGGLSGAGVGGLSGAGVGGLSGAGVGGSGFGAAGVAGIAAAGFGGQLCPNGTHAVGVALRASGFEQFEGAKVHIAFGVEEVTVVRAGGFLFEWTSQDSTCNLFNANLGMQVGKLYIDVDGDAQCDPSVDWYFVWRSVGTQGFFELSPASPHLDASLPDSDAEFPHEFCPASDGIGGAGGAP